MTLSSTWAETLSRINYNDLPPCAVETAKKSFLDTIGVILAANTLGEGCGEFVDLAQAQGGRREATIIGFRAKVPAALAAFANGSMAHALDFEDTHDRALVHSNAAVVPAALAMAEALPNISGKDFLTAIVMGSEVVCRLGLALTVNPLEYGWYIPPVLGAFGATSAACKLLGLTAEQTLNALSLTLCQSTCSAELIHSPNSVIRSIRDAFSAKAGVLSAELARRGVTGFQQPLEGKAGLFSLYARGNYDPGILTADFGQSFECAGISFKPWPSCRGTHSSIEAVLHLAMTHCLNAEEIEEIKLVVSPVNKMLCEPLERKQVPHTAIEGKFSLPFVVAAALVHKNVTLETFSPQGLSDSAVLNLAKKVVFEVETGINLKEATRGCVHITTRGKTISKGIEFAYGNPENPMDLNAFDQKFLDCAKYSAQKIDTADLKKIIRLVMSLEQADTLHEITRYL